MDIIPIIDSGRPTDEFAEDLVKFGVSTAHARALADCAFRSGLFAERTDGRGSDELDVEMAARIAAGKYRPWSEGGQTLAALLMSLEGVYRALAPTDDSRSDEFRQFVQMVSEALGVSDYGPGLAALDEKTLGGLERFFVEGMLGAGLISVETALDFDLIPARAEGNRSPGDPKTSYRTPEFWLDKQPAYTLETIADRFCGLPDDRAAAFALGLERTLRDWFMSRQRYDRVDEDGASTADMWDYWEGIVWRDELAPRMAPMVSSLAERAARHPDDTKLGYAWFYYLSWVYGCRPGVLDQEKRRHAVSEAKRRLAAIRPTLEAAKQQSSRDVFDAQHRMLHYAAVTLMYFASVWDAVKPLLLALRRLAVPSVSDDLRYWPEPNDGGNEPPCLWRELPTMISAVLHHGLPREQEKHPKLKSIRTAFAEFILERLRPREKRGRRGDRPLIDDDMLEPKPAWRIGYVRAFRALSVNPAGKGHRTIDWIQKHDPNEDVRAEAAAALGEVRKGVGIPHNMSPRRPLFAAFLWLRRAHLEALGGAVAERGAQRTFRKEVRRTEEPRR